MSQSSKIRYPYLVKGRFLRWRYIYYCKSIAVFVCLIMIMLTNMNTVYSCAHKCTYPIIIKMKDFRKHASAYDNNSTNCAQRIAQRSRQSQYSDVIIARSFWACFIPRYRNFLQYCLVFGSNSSKDGEGPVLIFHSQLGYSESGFNLTSSPPSL
ncbi:hypothetical protein PUN28_013682 [Cardiocondyla obscurior]|uniref:Uncharacterized protein n=1 Tax=Cardiocondyla obscurior TaxID=286306 RepID=A0AAW2F4R3_9HYME